MYDDAPLITLSLFRLHFPSFPPRHILRIRISFLPRGNAQITARDERREEGRVAREDGSAHRIPGVDVIETRVVRVGIVVDVVI